MAEIAATAIGIAGVVGVLQGLLQCYKTFLTARDFGDDYATLQLRVALLENSTMTWAIAVGLIDESGVPCNKFLVVRPTENNVRLVESTLKLIRRQLDAAIEELAKYTDDAPTPHDESNAEEPLPRLTGVARPNVKPSMVKGVANKLHRTMHRQHDERHPGTFNRTIWALVDKARLDDVLNTVTKLVDRLNTDFAPVDQKQQLDRLCENLKELRMSGEELEVIRKSAGDELSQRVLKMLENEHRTGNKFVGMKITKEGMVNIGDHYDRDYKGEGMVRQQRHNDAYEDLHITDRAFFNRGDTFGGKSAVQIRLEQMQAPRQANSGGQGD